MLPKISPQQKSCVREAKESNQSLAINSVAGSGKTFTLGKVSQSLRGTGISTSFSRETTLELGNKISPSFPARTMHGIGKDAIASHFGKCQVDSKNQKTHSFVKQTLEELAESPKLIFPILSLIDKAQTAGIVPEHHKYLIEDTEENWITLAEKYDIRYSPLIHHIARSALIHSNTLALKEQIISFNDMLYIPLFFPIRVLQHSIVIIDEAQDLSPIQHALLRKMLRRNGRIIAAGDKNQAIYAFRGALNDSFSKLSDEFQTKNLSLTVSFRCPQAVVTEAKIYVPEIESAPSAIVGDVIHHEELRLTSLPRTILCRNNAPLIKTALKLFTKGHSVEVAGRDVGIGLKALTTRIASGRNSNLMKSSDFLSRLLAWRGKELLRNPWAKERIKDKVETFMALSRVHPTLGDIRKHIGSLYIDPRDKNRRTVEFHFTTIHKAKGREWEEVLFLDPKLIPSKYATTPQELQQERNLAYVGITRAQKILHYCNSENIY